MADRDEEESTGPLPQTMKTGRMPDGVARLARRGAACETSGIVAPYAVAGGLAALSRGEARRHVGLRERLASWRLTSRGGIASWTQGVGL